MRKYVFLSLSLVFVLGAVSVCSAMEREDIKEVYKKAKRQRSERAARTVTEFLEQHPNLRERMAMNIDFSNPSGLSQESRDAFRRRLLSLTPLNFTPRSLNVPLEDGSASALRVSHLPAEEVPAEEVPAEGVLSEEVLTEEVPTEEKLKHLKLSPKK